MFKTALQSFTERTLIKYEMKFMCMFFASLFFSIIQCKKKIKKKLNFFLQPTVSADVLERYIALEEKIAAAEKDSPAMLLQQKQEQIQQLSIRIEEQKELVDQLSAQAIQEKRDVDELEGDTDTRKLFMKQGNLEEQMQKEISEYLDAKNKEVNSSNEIVSDFLSFL